MLFAWQTPNQESAHIAALTSVVASKYSPISGLITDNNYNQYTKAAGGTPGGGVSFANPGAPAAPSAPGTPGANAPGSIDGVGAFTPDWAGLISGDAGLLDAKNALAAGGVQDIASRNAALARGVVAFGKAPDFSALAKSLGMSEADIQNALGPDVAKLAQENTDAGTSTEARLGQANTDAIRQIRASLNKRGILNSGEAGFQLDRQNTGYRQAEYDANQKLLDYLNQYQQGYVSAQQNKQGQLATAYSDAANRQYANNQGSAGFKAYETSPNSGIFKGPDGRLYNADGSPYTAPQAPQGDTLNMPGRNAVAGRNFAA